MARERRPLVITENKGLGRQIRKMIWRNQQKYGWREESSQWVEGFALLFEY